MKRLAFIALITSTACTATPPAEVVQARWVSDLDTLLVRIDRLGEVADTATPTVVLAAFADARDAFKRTEYLSEYFTPETMRSINGPPIARVRDDDPTLLAIPPEGFQVVEERIFEAPGERETPLSEEIAILRANIVRLRTFAAAQSVTDAHVFDAARLELLRVFSLGLSGFDSPVALRSLDEAAVALKAVGDAVDPYMARASGAERTRMRASIAAAVLELKNGTSFDEFDRLAFAMDHLVPIWRALDALRARLDIGLPTVQRAWKATAATPFDSAAWDLRFFGPPGLEMASHEQVALGRVLFFSPSLSGSGDRSCSTCHVPSQGFAENRARSVSLTKEALRNAPSLLNAGLQAGSFYDLRTAYLEDQVAAVLASPHEMNAPAPIVANALANQPTWVGRFRRAYPNAPEPVSPRNLQHAIASFVRSLAMLESRFDRHLRGQATLSAEERAGFNVFMGKAKCGTCHFAPLFSGTVPPLYPESEVEVIGVPDNRNRRTIDPDVGRMAVSRSPLHEHAFRTPTVRNVGRTSPYMHNGVFETLEEVVDFYDAGGGAGLGIDLPHQTLPTDSLRLTLAEKQALIAFLRSLETREQ